MALKRFFSIAFRNLVRNGRRSVLTGLAVALGLVAVMAMAGMIEGMVGTMVADGIRITSGHLQIRNLTYDENEESLLADNLLRDGEAMAAQVESVPEVVSAAPVLWFGGLLSTPQESTGIQLMGIDTEDAFHAPIREGIVAGNYLSNDDRRLVLVGRTLAEQMEIGVGDRVSIAAGSAAGGGQEGVFTVAGLVD
ncbi:MAG: ABC transporter permease, partial [Anaerolineales bacterium]|nr:ABC transporter permease [Anaerolineales bacterium]